MFQDEAGESMRLSAAVLLLAVQAFTARTLIQAPR